MSHDIGNRVAGSMLGHVESQAGHHRRHPRGPHPGRGRRHLRRLQGLGLQADRPLPRRGRGRVRTAIPTTEDLTRRHRPSVVELILELREQLAAAGLDAGPDTIAWHLEHHHGHRVSRSTISRHLARAGTRGPRTEEATEVLLHPVRGHHAERDLAVRLHPLPARRTRRRTGIRGGDHQLARRLHPLRPARHRPPAGHRPDRHRHLPRSPCPARDPGLHAHRQRHGLHRPPRRRPRRTQHLRERTQTTARGPEELPPQPPHHLRQGREIPADDEEVAARPTRPARHDRRAPDPHRCLRR